MNFFEFHSEKDMVVEKEKLFDFDRIENRIEKDGLFSKNNVFILF